MDVFTAENPSGDVTTAEWFRGILIAMLVVALSVSMKRHLIALHLGQRLYSTLSLLLTLLSCERIDVPQTK